MKTYLLTISSPDGCLYSGQVERITLRGAEGDLAVMAGHVPFITSVQPGECLVHMEDGTVKHAKTEGGLLTVTHEAVTLLTAAFQWV